MTINSKQGSKGRKEKGIQEKQGIYYQKVQHKMVEMNTKNSVITK